ncbi:hypothetical protein TNCV_4460931 [Trichonephila clavipes]|nr:hypothetical protein TNCV_4460931 [Trichonephila clavipes]
MMVYSCKPRPDRIDGHDKTSLAAVASWHIVRNPQFFEEYVLEKHLTINFISYSDHDFTEAESRTRRGPPPRLKSWA